jgi:hypothetical protein
MASHPLQRSDSLVSEAGNSVQRTWKALFTSKLSVKARLVMSSLLFTIATLAVWQHFFYKRLQHLQAKYSNGTETTSNYTQKVYVPPFVYATKHTILLSMVVLLLTMCRKTKNILSRTTINRFLPLESTTDMHKIVGIWMVAQTLFAFLAFAVQYGSLCALYRRGLEDEDYCWAFGGEIYITGERMPRPLTWHALMQCADLGTAPGSSRPGLLANASTSISRAHTLGTSDCHQCTVRSSRAIIKPHTTPHPN